MNISDLMNKFRQHPLIQQLGSEIAMLSPQSIILKHVSGSFPAFVMAAVYGQEQALNHLVVCESEEEAAYMFNTLEALTDAIDIFYFPSVYKNKKANWEVNKSHLMLRTEALAKMSSQKNKKILVTYPEALLENVVHPEQLANQFIFIQHGEVLDTENLFLQLVNNGFEKTDFVYEPGQFSQRGGILDIYSFGNDKPYRIELNDIEVESIRIIDPETQLSERKLLQVTIIPNLELNQAGIELHTMPSVLADNTVVWVDDYFLMKEKIFRLEKSIHSQVENNSNNEIDGLKNKFSSVDDVEKSLQRFWKIQFSSNEKFDKDCRIIEFSTLEQPSFNRQFDILIDDLKKWKEKNYELFIFAENPKQLERLYSIFSDLQTDIQFTPIVKAIHQGFIEHSLKMVCYTDHQIFQRYHKYKIKTAYNKNKALTLRMLRELQPGDFVTHIDHGVGVYSGLQKIDVNGKLQEAIRIIYHGNDILYVNISSLHKIAKYTGKEGTIPKINKLGSDVWNKLKEKTKAKVKELAFDLIKLYATRKAQKGFQFGFDTYLQTELEASFIYEDTPDQSRASADVKKDMENPSPMDRLVCGDVGFGKTEVAIRAAFKANVDGKQAAILVPTTILAYQHFKTFSDRLKDFPVTVEYLNRFRSTKERKEILEKLKEGKIDIIIGTHGLLGKNILFKDLGLLIIDEEQKFGVAHKEKIKLLKSNVDCLTLTATPIPRTLQFSLMGARDLSIINTPPPNRQPIQTELMVFNEEAIRDAIYFETERNGQVFFIHNRVKTLTEIKLMIQNLCPDLAVGMAHGQMEGHLLEQQILQFIEGKFDVLVCTNIVESGVDIPNVNTIIVNNAHQFGLSDLHQLRGRVGRSNKKAFCYLISPPFSLLPDDSRKRLQTLEQHSELGSGFQIAMRDLDIRGAGNILGGEQSGFITDIGFETYQKILQEAIRDLKRSDFKDLFKEEISKQDDFVSDCMIDTDVEVLIPDSYVENITERLSLYQRMDNCENDEELMSIREELMDRFGALPQPVEDLILVIKTRKLAIALGFEKIALSDGNLKLYFISRPDSPYFESDCFKNILNFIQTKTNKVQIQQRGKIFYLVIKPINSVSEMHEFIVQFLSGVK